MEEEPCACEQSGTGERQQPKTRPWVTEREVKVEFDIVWIAGRSRRGFFPFDTFDRG
jgi:hypothetical protein